MTNFQVLELVHEQLAGHEGLVFCHLDYPGYLHIKCKSGHYNVVFDGRVWAIDGYLTEQPYLDGSQPDTSGNISVAVGTTNPTQVSQAILRYVGAINHRQTRD